MIEFMIAAVAFGFFVVVFGLAAYLGLGLLALVSRPLNDVMHRLLDRAESALNACRRQ